MSDSQPVESHRAIDYVLDFHPDQATLFHVEASADGRKVIIQGICPGCGGRTQTEWTTGTGNGYKSIFSRSSAAAKACIPDRNRLVKCECGHAHPNRPDTELYRGCGANWYVEMP